MAPDSRLVASGDAFRWRRVFGVSHQWGLDKVQQNQVFPAKLRSNSGCPASRPALPTCHCHKEHLNWDILAPISSVGGCKQDRPGSPRSHTGDSPETRRRLPVDKYGYLSCAYGEALGRLEGASWDETV